MKKKNLFLFLITLMVAMYSCSSGDDLVLNNTPTDNNTPTNSNIVGKWQYVKSHAEVEATPTSVKEKIEEDYLEILNNDYIEFRSDGTGTDTDVPTELTYTVNGNKLTVTYLRYNDIITYEFFISSNSLITKFDLTDSEGKDYEESDPGSKVTKLISITEFKRILE